VPQRRLLFPTLAIVPIAAAGACCFLDSISAHIALQSQGHAGLRVFVFLIIYGKPITGCLEL
jgi:hypothetical protein